MLNRKLEAVDYWITVHLSKKIDSGGGGSEHVIGRVNKRSVAKSLLKIRMMPA